MVMQPDGPKQAVVFRQLEISPKIQVDPRLLGLVENATRALKDSIRRPSASVDAHWDAAKDGSNHTVTELTLEDWAGDVKGVFSQDDLSNPDRLRRQLFMLYDDLLANRSHKQLDKLFALADTGDAE